MIMAPRFVVGLDGSPRQPLVIERALQQAQRAGAQLHLCRAVSVPTHLPAEVWAMDGDTLGDTLTRVARQELQELAEGLPVPAQVHVELGVPSDVLCAVAQSTQAAMVIIGTHGFSTIDVLLGTTAAKVVNRAPCSVLVVRE